MSSDNPQPASVLPAQRRWQWVSDVPWERLTIWALFLLVLCLLRRMLLILFLTFMVCYLARTIIGGLARRFWPNQDRRWLERLLSVGFFAALFLVVATVLHWLGPLALDECRQLVARVSNLDPDYEFHRALSRTVGAYQFHRAYGGPDNPQYEQEFKKFVALEKHGQAAYQDFPDAIAAVQRSVVATLDAAEKARLAAELARKTASGRDFQNWLAQRHAQNETGEDPASAVPLERQWRGSLVDQRLEEERSSPPYQQKLRDLYAEAQKGAPQNFPYDYDRFQELNAAYAKGEAAFIAALGPPIAADNPAGQAKLHAAFEHFERRRLAEQWWASDPVAALVRHHAEADLDFLAGEIGQRAGDLVKLLLGLPAQLATVLLLSFFITVDFPGLRAGFRSLEHSRLGFLFDDLFPGLAKLGDLIGKAFLAQGIVSLIDSTLIYAALALLGVENPLLLSVVVFVFSFVPVVGVILSAVPIAVMALVQSNGSLGLALWALGAVLLVHLIEATVLSPRIVGKMLHLHPVLGIVVLGIAQQLFGIWGLLLAYPVTVYLILRVLGPKVEPNSP
ncbi:MAG: AI-2E family transporter [Thermoguttaceae bacterium]